MSVFAKVVENSLLRRPWTATSERFVIKSIEDDVKAMEMQQCQISWRTQRGLIRKPVDLLPGLREIECPWCRILHGALQ